MEQAVTVITQYDQIARQFPTQSYIRPMMDMQHLGLSIAQTTTGIIFFLLPCYLFPLIGL
jgi:hypothetical protein